MRFTNADPIKGQANTEGENAPKTGADGLRPHQGLKARGVERNRSQRKHATGVVEVSRTQANAQPLMLNATTATKQDTTPRSALQRKSE